MFDNDGTLWCEKPMPIQLDFILRRLAEMAEADPELRERQPWKAAYERDYAWLGPVHGRALRGRRHQRATLLGGHPGRLRRHQRRRLRGAGRTPFLRTAQHPTLGRGYVECAYAPMVELLGYLEANGFTNYIASGGGRDFMRPISQEVYGIPRERVIGSSSTFTYTSNEQRRHDHAQAGGRLPRRRPEKPVRIWSRIGRRPLLAAGNSNGDIPMLEFTHHADKPTLRLLVLHDDAEREFDYTSGAEQALERAADRRLDGRQHEERLDHGLLSPSHPHRPAGAAAWSSGPRRTGSRQHVGQHEGHHHGDDDLRGHRDAVGAEQQGGQQGRGQRQPQHRRAHRADAHARSPAPGSCRAARLTAMPSAAPMNIAGKTGPPRKALSERP